MKEKIVTGKAFYCGDFVDTDVMSPGRYEPFGSDEELARIALIDYPSDVPFVDAATGKSPFKVIFAGEEFGCGSSRETAPLALSHAGAKFVIARSFARIFFRNCINLGVILPIVYPHPYDASIIGQEVTINAEELYFQVGEERFHFNDFGPLTAIVEAGGLTNYTKKRIASGELK